jgi:hypothetical protein
MEKYMDLPRATSAFMTDLASQAQRDQFRRGKIQPDTLFPGYQDPATWKEGLGRRIIIFLQEWGEFFSVMISLYCMGKILITIAGGLYSLFILRDTHGLRRALCWIPFTTLFLIRAYRDSPYGLGARIDRVARRNLRIQTRGNPTLVPQVPNLEGYISPEEIASPRNPPLGMKHLQPQPTLGQDPPNNPSYPPLDDPSLKL